MRDAESGCLEGSRVIKIELLEHQRLYFARCTKLQFRGPDGNDRTGLGVLINHVDWQKNAILKAAKMFGLTRAEAHLLGYLLRGCSQTAAARAMSKSRETVRAQAKSILRKTKTTQMSDVIQLMTGYMFMTEDQPAPAHAAPATADFPDQGEVLRLPNGRRVQINRLGQKGGRPLMFFHGLYPGPFITPTLNDQFRAAGFDVLAASRPGFNGTDAPGEWAHFEQQVTEDVVAICDVLGWTKLDFLVHQTGTSFACRAAQALEGRVGSAVMVGASVPIKDDMLKTMTRDARVAAAAVKYAPKVLELIFRVSVAQLRQQGSYTFLANKMAHSAVEFETLDHPETGPVIERSLHHLASGGPEAIMQDGACAMSDWETAYHYLPKRQLWLHGARDPVINVQFVREFLERQGQAAPVIYADRGGDVLLAEAKDVVARLSTFLDEGAA
ncbi:alpha/beta hydrolase [Pontivivens insulae]|uniref:alpha/beta hydrolase n=1 Tax=Pontivivens insulae TaxID=1639689 RepID=UPI0013C2CB29|nr:alpha/beta hydrolase [Pontivivens insulae]